MGPDEGLVGSIVDFLLFVACCGMTTMSIEGVAFFLTIVFVILQVVYKSQKHLTECQPQIG